MTLLWNFISGATSRGNCLPMEKCKFPLGPFDVEVLTDQPVSPFAAPGLSVSETDFSLVIDKIAGYRAAEGSKVWVTPHPEADAASVRLFLTGSVLGAILHQRRLLPFHGSSFEYMGKGVAICGVSGVGKSSVATAFCQHGAQFISDDITPVRLSGSRVVIVPLHTQTKLWDDSFQKLGIENRGLEKIRPLLGKFYLPKGEIFPREQQLDYLFVLGAHDKEEFVVTELTGMEKYNALRRQIYRRIYLKGMPETEKSYFKLLFQLAARVKVVRVLRPWLCDIYDAMRRIEAEIGR